MSRKLFSSYLLEKDIIGVEDFIKIRMDQAQQTPSAFEIIYQNSLLDQNTLQEILEHQSRSSTDFISSCKELGYWTEDLQHSVSTNASKALPPFTKYLVQKGLLEESDLIHAVDDFLSSEAFTDEGESNPESKSEVETKAFDQESSFEAFLSDQQFESMKKTLRGIEEKTETKMEEPLLELCQELRVLSGTLRMRELKDWEELFDLLFETFTLLSEKKGLVSEETRKSVIDGCDKALDLFKQEVLNASNSSEKKISEETKEEVSKIQKGLLKDHFDLDMLFNE
jgi:hypothetical protein